MRINAFTWLALVAACVCTAPRSQVRTQQDLFNVPSGIATRPGHALVQQQLNPHRAARDELHDAGRRRHLETSSWAST
ncbi:MAG: hypothetical protein JWN04_2042 [Myxococcaceae bacterium]|nr:hypothetical protein [Myxococcaceae bacterium]